MSGMLNPQQHNNEQREKNIDLVISAMGPTNEKSAFLLALMIKDSNDPVKKMNEISTCLDAAYAAGGNTDHSAGSTYSELKLMYQNAVMIYHRIKDI